MLVDRCVCREVTFRDLQKVAEAHACRTMDDLRVQREFGTGCGLCLPYVREMLKSGRTEFHSILEDEHDQPA